MLASLIWTPLFLGIIVFIFSRQISIRELGPSLATWYCIVIFKTVEIVYRTCIELPAGSYIYIFRFFNWSSINASDLEFGFFLDYTAIIMCLTVLVVTFCVLLFSFYYMGSDPFFNRFLTLINVFAFCMLLLVSALDLIQFFIGWELVGLCSFFLINYWYSRRSANKAAMKAVFINRIGDYTLMVALSLLILKYNTLNIIDLSHYFIITPPNENILICVCLFISVMSKSAQFGLHMWLPDAMEGPTPVSALIHAATMVTAGVYLMLRLSIIFVTNPHINLIIIVVGSITALFGASTAIAQSDIKKIIAFSTCSQLGYMVVACGFGEFSAGFFHLITHAYFKALLFICAGVVIHNLNGEQDLRKMGGLANILPITFAGCCIASAALMGFPFLSGYYSKELIIGISLADSTVFGCSVMFILTLASIFTSLYSAKIVYYVFISQPRFPLSLIKKIVPESLTVSNLFYILPITFLSILSIFSGYYLKEIIVPCDNNKTLSIYDIFISVNSRLDYSEFLPFTIKIILNLIPFIGIVYYTKKFIFVKTSISYTKFRSFTLEVYNFLYNRWYFDYLVSYYIVNIFYKTSSNNFLVNAQNYITEGIFVKYFVEISNFKSLSTRDSSSLTAKGVLKHTFISFIVVILTINTILIIR